MTIENEELDEAALFDQAVSDEPELSPEPEPQIEQPEKTEPELAAEPEAGKAPVDDNAPLVPSWRLREINEEKRTLVEKVAALEAEKSQWQRPQAQPPKEPEKEKAAKPDPLLDPEGYDAYIEAKVEAKLLNNHRETDLRLTRQANTELFDKAYGESQRLKAAQDPAFLELSQKMHSTSEPGKVLLAWYKDRSTKAEIGDDLTAYKQRLREEALKDPEFRKAAMEAWRNDAPSQTNGRPNIQLAPSLSGASRSNAALRSDNGDISDAELFQQTIG